MESDMQTWAKYYLEIVVYVHIVINEVKLSNLFCIISVFVLLTTTDNTFNESIEAKTILQKYHLTQI